MKYVFKPYNRNFPELFETEKERLASKVSATCIEHVGSTAIPNMGGKGIIDIAIASDEVDLITEQLQKLGYELRPNWSTPTRKFFRADLPDPEETIRRYHIHLMRPNSKDWIDMLHFRDHLRNHPEDAQAYTTLKKSAAESVNGDGAEYRKIKEPFFIKYRAMT